jgi:hypothetical protein
MSFKQRLFFLLALLINFTLSGCTPVSPWQRGTLAKAAMAVEPNPMQTLLSQHTHSSREAASAGGSASGGGCGCY